MGTKPTPRTFAARAAFRAWLERHHGTRAELLVRCYKSRASRKGLTYTQALDEALCFGWIDGVRRRLDEDSFSVRFSPRQPKSAWSAVNIGRARRLERAGRMRPPGRAALRRRAAGGAEKYSYASRPRALAPAYRAELRRNERAWRFFQALPPWYQRTTAFWVMSAKREETRARWLAVLIACSARAQAVPPLQRAPGK